MAEVATVRGFLLVLCSTSGSSFRLNPGAGELSLEAGGDGGRSGGGKVPSGPRIWK